MPTEEYKITDSYGLQGGKQSSYSVVTRIGLVRSTKYTSGAGMKLFLYFAAVFGTISFLAMFWSCKFFFLLQRVLEGEISCKCWMITYKPDCFALP